MYAWWHRKEAKRLEEEARRYWGTAADLEEDESGHYSTRARKFEAEAKRHRVKFRRGSMIARAFCNLRLDWNESKVRHFDQKMAECREAFIKGPAVLGVATGEEFIRLQSTRAIYWRRAERLANRLGVQVVPAS